MSHLIVVLEVILTNSGRKQFLLKWARPPDIGFEESLSESRSDSRRVQTALKNRIATFLFTVVNLPMLLVLAGGQWLLTKQLGFLYVAEPFLVLAFVASLVLLRISPVKLRDWARWEVLLFLLVPTQGLVALARGGLAEDTLRDFHPFLVSIYGLMVAFSIRQFQHARRFILAFFSVGLLIHFTLISARILFRNLAPGAGQEILERTVGSGPQVDSLILAMTALVALWLLFRTRAWWQRFVVSGIALVAIAEIIFLDNRAGQLALACGLALFSIMAMVSIEMRGNHLKKIARVVTVVVVSTSGSLLATTTSDRSFEEFIGGLRAGTAITASALSNVWANDQIDKVGVETEDFESTQSIARPETGPKLDDQSLRENQPNNQLPFSAASGEPGSGTVRARIAAWFAVVEYLSENPATTAFGVGFGTNYFVDSGARVALMGTGERVEGENRWPHNYLVTIFASSGLIGLLSYVMLQAVAFFRLFRREVIQSEFPSFFALTLLVVFSIGSLFGVIWENPWGSIPISWAIGVSISGALPRVK